MLTKIPRIDHHLQDSKQSPSNIQQSIHDRKAFRTLPFVVHVRLREVLDQGRRQLNVAQHVQKVQPVVRPEPHRTGRPNDDVEVQDDDGFGGFGDRVAAVFVHVTLQDRESGGKARVNRESHVVTDHRVEPVRVSFEVLLLDGRWFV